MTIAPNSSSLSKARENWNDLTQELAQLYGRVSLAEHRRCLIEFVGFLSAHPRLHILTEDGLLQNNLELAIRLVDEYLKTDERVRDEERNDHE